MFQLPPVPSWDGLHPLIIHFPIVLLLVAPVLIVIGALLKPEKGGVLLWTALTMMILGTASVFVAVETGEAAGKLAERTPEINVVLEHHEELAERTRIAFSVLTIVFSAILLVPKLVRRASSRVVTTVLPLVFVVLYGVGTLLLVNTAHNGGRLVHELGVTAMVSPTNAPATGPEAPPVDRD
jgi:uncharacterized membrane protein